MTAHPAHTSAADATAFLAQLAALERHLLLAGEEELMNYAAVRMQTRRAKALTAASARRTSSRALWTASRSRRVTWASS